MKRLFSFLAVLSSAALACGFLTPPATVAVLTVQPSTPQPANPSRPTRNDPSASASKVQKDITYCTVDGVELKMDIYDPKNATGITPLVVYIHGGGWSSGSKNGGAGIVDAYALLDAGFTVASLDYRLAPQYKMPAMIEDVKCAIRSLRAHASDYNIDPYKIGVWGGSAGGHLVNMLGTSDQSAGFDVGEYLDQSSRVQAVVDMFGPTDLTIEFSGGYAGLKDKVFGDFSAVQASPVTYISADDPPFLILQGNADQVVPLSQSQGFYDKLTAAGVSAELVIVQNAGHAFKPMTAQPINPTREEITQRVVAFFNKHLR